MGMNDFERDIMSAVIESHVRLCTPPKGTKLKYPEPAVRSLEEFERRWEGKDFTPTFENVINTLPERRREAVIMHGAEGKSFREIAEVFGVTRARTYEIYHEAIRELARHFNKGRLFMDEREYAEYSMKMAKIEADRQRQREQDPYISDLNMSDSASDRIIRYFVANGASLSDNITVSYTLKNLPSLNKLHQCGVKFKGEIINAFKEIGANVSHWEKEYQDTYFKKKAVCREQDI